MDWMKRHKWWLIAAVIIFLVLLWAPSVYAKFSTSHYRYDPAKTPVAQIPHRHVAVVFGAGLLSQNEPTPYLRQRVATAAELYKAHRVDRLLMTGDNTAKNYNEPKVMKDLAVQLGVPADKITLDYAGLSTYDSCYRAQAIFKVKSATVITQGYHLPRAVMACRGLGIDAIGVRARHNGRDFATSYIWREWISTDKITLQLIFKPKPTALGQIIPIN